MKTKLCRFKWHRKFTGWRTKSKVKAAHIPRHAKKRYMEGLTVKLDAFFCLVFGWYCFESWSGQPLA